MIRIVVRTREDAMNFTHFIFVLGLALPTMPALADTYSVQSPYPMPGGTNVTVERTDQDGMAHIKASFIVPAGDDSVGPYYSELFFYGWIRSNKFGLKMCESGPACADGDTAKFGTFKPGDLAVIETDLPVDFVDAAGASLYIGIRGTKGPYFPIGNLLHH